MEPVSGTRAGQRDRIVCPRVAAQSKPAASAPPARTERPPVARTTREAATESASRRTSKPPPSRSETSRTGIAERTSAPAARACATSASRTSRARFDGGKSFDDSGSSRRGPPRISSKKARCPASGKRSRKRSTSRRGEEETKRARASRSGRTLQWPPPETRIFLPGSRAASRTTTCASLPASRRRAAADAAASSPAAPPPTITMPVSIAEIMRLPGTGSHAESRPPPRLHAPLRRRVDRGRPPSPRRLRRGARRRADPPALHRVPEEVHA